MADLSPQAQAVLDAWENKLLPDVTCLTHDPEREALAAALRAAAEQVVIKLAGLGQESAWYLEEIATELEAQ